MADESSQNSNAAETIEEKSSSNLETLLNDYRNNLPSNQRHLIDPKKDAQSMVDLKVLSDRDVASLAQPPEPEPEIQAREAMKEPVPQAPKPVTADELRSLIAEMSRGLDDRIARTLESRLAEVRSFQPSQPVPKTDLEQVDLSELPEVAQKMIGELRGQTAQLQQRISELEPWIRYVQTQSHRNGKEKVQDAIRSVLDRARLSDEEKASALAAIENRAVTDLQGHGLQSEEAVLRAVQGYATSHVMEHFSDRLGSASVGPKPAPSQAGVRTTVSRTPESSKGGLEITPETYDKLLQLGSSGIQEIARRRGMRVD